MALHKTPTLVSLPYHSTMKPTSSFLQTLSHSLNFWVSWIKEDDNQTSFILSFFAVIALLWWFYGRISRWRLPPLPPGPYGIPLLGNLPFLDPELHTYFAELGRRYGPIVKLHLGKKVTIVINSPSVAREVLKDQDITFANHDVPAAARAAAYGGHDIVWTPYGPEWRMLRKVCVQKMLSNNTLDSFYALRRREVRNAVVYFHSRVGSPVNIGEQAFLTVLNVVTSMLWGGTVEGEERERLGSEFRDVVSEITNLLMIPNVSDFFPGLARFDLQGVVKKMGKPVRRLDEIFDRMIDQRLRINGDAEKKDFLQFLLKLKDEEDSSTTPFTMTHLKALLMDMVVGGTDTSSNTIEFAMAELLKNPEAMKTAQKELTTVIGENNIVEESDIKNLPYLHSIFKETLRLHPILPLLVPHRPTKTTTIANFTVPKDSRVFVNVWAIQRDSNYWENPLEFKPERFLNSDWDYSGSDLRYFPFGSGRRICAGLGMAERTVMYLLATVLHSFDWKVRENEELDVSEKFGIVLKKKVPLVAVPTLRLADPALYL